MDLVNNQEKLIAIKEKRKEKMRIAKAAAKNTVSKKVKKNKKKEGNYEAPGQFHDKVTREEAVNSSTLLNFQANFFIFYKNSSISSVLLTKELGHISI